MNRIVVFGLGGFFGLVGVGLLGEPQSANAFHGSHMYGGFTRHAWHGCHGQGRCYGCQGYGCHSCYGCQGCGGCYGCSGSRSCYSCYGCHGCHGCYGCEGGGQMTAPLPVQTEIWAPASDAPATGTPKSASLQVLLPPDARLIVGDFDTQSLGSVRQFESPALLEGKTYAYELRAELNRDGRTLTETKTIVVQRGQTVHVDFILDGNQLAQASER